MSLHSMRGNVAASVQPYGSVRGGFLRCLAPTGAFASMNAQGSIHQREKLVVIGNGMAGCRAVEEILARDPSRYAITIFGAEPRVNYNRIMLSPVLGREGLRRYRYQRCGMVRRQWHHAGVGRRRRRSTARPRR
jgi:hypothetical protein